MPSSAGNVVAYLVNQYPKVSHSFIRREIQAIESNGIDVLRISIRGWDGELVDDEDLAEQKRTRYVLRDGVIPLAFSALRMAVRSPLKFLRAVGLAARLSRQSDRPMPVHLVYVAEACHILPWLERAGVRHVHAHFGTNAAEIALLVRTLGGPTYSFTVHGPLEFDGAMGTHLAEKARGASLVVAISSFCSSQIRRWVDLDHWSKIRIVRCGVDEDFLKAADAGPSRGMQLVCVGRICEQKGQLLLIEAAAELVRRGQEFALVLAGDGEMRGVVEAQIRSRGLSYCVRITGWLTEAEVRAEILASRAMVLPSFAEGLPVVIMESLALERPVLSTYVAGIPELVRAGETGWLIPAGDVMQLAEAMQEVLNTPDPQLAAMGRRGRQRVSELHSVESEAARLAAEFKSVMASGRP